MATSDEIARADAEVLAATEARDQAWDAHLSAVRAHLSAVRAADWAAARELAAGRTHSLACLRYQNAVTYRAGLTTTTGPGPREEG